MAQRVLNPIVHDGPTPRGSGQLARIHDLSVRSSIRDIAGELQDLLSRRVTAYIVGVKDAKTVNRWANGEIDVIRNTEVERRLRTAYEISTMLLAVDGPPTVKAWFVSLNPYLADRSPAEAIRQGDERDVLIAARAFVSNG